jgi:hypothetical protein
VKMTSSVRTSDDFFISARPTRNVSVQLTSKPKIAAATEKNPIPFQE